MPRAGPSWRATHSDNVSMIFSVWITTLRLNKGQRNRTGLSAVLIQAERRRSTAAHASGMWKETRKKPIYEGNYLHANEPARGPPMMTPQLH